MTPIQSKTCEHCDEWITLRRGSWDTYDYHSDLWIQHECETMKAQRQAQEKAKGAAIAAAWTKAMEGWDERYGG